MSPAEIETGRPFSVLLTSDIRQGISVGWSSRSGIKRLRYCDHLRPLGEALPCPRNIHPELVIRHFDAVELERFPDLAEIPTAV